MFRIQVLLVRIQIGLLYPCPDPDKIRIGSGFANKNNPKNVTRIKKMFLCQKYLTLISWHANPKQIPLIQFGGLLDRIIQLLQFYVLSNSHFEYKNYLSLIALFLDKLYEHFFF